ncbi:MAG: metallophosphoesterase [Desulfuromonadales bacterium]|nr:metallophosphoesterase [Desulfuromonadales bacterium]
MKLVHLSDLHLGKDNNAADFASIITHLNTTLDFDNHDYGIVITGDLIEDASADQPFSKLKQLLTDLSPHFAGKVFLCPGNHDYGDFWGGHRDFIKTFRQEFADYLTGSNDIPREDYENTEMAYPESPFPVVDIINDLVLIGLDSTAEELADGYSLGAEGDIGERQRGCLDRLLELPEVRGRKVLVYLHHHPFKNRIILNKLRDAKEFMDVLEDRVDVLLFGHNHKYANCSSDSQPKGIHLALEGGASTKDMRFRVIDMNDLDCQEHSVPSE